MTPYAPGEKTHRDENFPVASYLIHKTFRPAILDFYAFARAADDVADHPQLAEAEKIARLDAFEATLLGQNDTIAEALRLRRTLAERQLSPRHALDLLAAFRQDARKQRYANWQELLDYCALSAAPVGRFVLEVHGENRETWPASDALCAALQIINHLQDCKADYMRLNRIYLPQDTLAKQGVAEAALAAAQSSPALRQCLIELAQNTQSLLAQPLTPQVQDTRLRIEVAVIEKLAHRLLMLLQTRDPLSERVHLPKAQMILMMMQAVWGDWLAPPQGNSARGSSFYLAMRLMPQPKRSAMYEIYQFCRAIDDIADDNSAPSQKRLEQLQQWRGDIEQLYAGNPRPELAALAAAVQRFGLQKQDFLDVIDGMEMDVRGPIRAPDMPTLERYCDRVACAVGRLSVRVFGIDGADGITLAHHLGMALQLTNILRDIDEDAALGRLYLPRELLGHAGISGNIPAHACEALAQQALAHFAAADRLMQPYARARVRAPRMMSQAYRALLQALLKRGFAAPRAPVRLGKPALGLIMLRNLV